MRAMSRSPDVMYTELADFYRERAEHFRNRFQRLIPFGDMIADRWAKAKLLGFGQGTSVYDSVLVLGDVSVGEHTWVGPQVVLDGAGASLSVGDYCSICSGVQIYTHHTVAWAVTGGKRPYEYAPVAIGSCVYIGPNTVIAKGVNIGNHVIIGAQSLVNRALPDYAVAWGQPARQVGRIVITEDGSDYCIQYLKEKNCE